MLLQGRLNEQPVTVVDRGEPVLGDDDATWAKLVDAIAGRVVEFGDEAEHGTSAAFQKHLAGAGASTRWDGDERVLHVSYKSGGDLLEMGFRTEWARDKDLWEQVCPQISVE